MSELFLVRDFEGGCTDGGRRERQNGGRGGVEEERVMSKEQLDGFVVTGHMCGWDTRVWRGRFHLCRPTLSRPTRVVTAAAARGPPAFACLFLYFVLPQLWEGVAENSKCANAAFSAPSTEFICSLLAHFPEAGKKPTLNSKAQTPCWLPMCDDWQSVPAGALMFTGKGRGGCDLASVTLSCMWLIDFDNNCMWLMSLPAIFVR